MSESLFAFGFTNNKKIRKLSDAAFRLWITAIDHCNEEAIAGIVRPGDLETFQRCPRGQARTAAIAELVAAELWHVFEGGWLIHDFEEWQAAAQERAAKQRQARDRMRANRSANSSQEQFTENDPPRGTENGEQLPEPFAGQNSAVSPETPSDPGSGFKLGAEGSGSPELPVKTRSPGGRAGRKTRLPVDWRPTEEHRVRASELGLNLAREADKFRLHAEATGRLMVSWNAAFSMWLSNADRYASEPGKRRGPVATGDDAEARTRRRNNLIDDAKAGRYGAEVARRARHSGTDLSRLADELENTPAPNVAQLAAGVGRRAP